MMNIVDRQTPKPLWYYYQDGLDDMMSGLLLIGLSLLFSPPFRGSAHFLYALAFVGLCLLINPAKDYLRSRCVYPRIGYVSAAAINPWPARAAAILIGSLVVLTIGLLHFYGWQPLIILIGGFCIGGLRILYFFRLRSPRSLAIGCVSIALSIVLTALRIDAPQEYYVYFAGLGLTLTLAGGVAFRQYLTRKPYVTEENT